MTKFVKGILTIGLLAGAVVGGKYGYDYLKSEGYFISNDKTNVSEAVVEEIDTFLNDQYNIGFLQMNYEELKLNDLHFETIAYLLNNPYKKGSDGITVEKYDFSNTDSFKRFINSYDSNLLDSSVCYNSSEINRYIYSITNQYVDALQSAEEICIVKLSTYIYMINVNIDKVVFKNEEYNVFYTIDNAENAIYNQKHSYDVKNKSYDGHVVLNKLDDGRYIFVSNEIKSARNLYSY